MKKVILIIYFLGLAYFVQAQEKDSTFYEYARVKYLILYYEDGRNIDLKTVLNLKNPFVYSVENENANFFKIVAYMRKADYHFLTFDNALVFKKQTVIKLKQN